MRWPSGQRGSQWFRVGEALLLAGVHSVDVAASGETGFLPVILRLFELTTTNLLVFSLFLP